MQHILLVGFHHKVGSQIEYIYPIMTNETKEEEALSAELFKSIPLIALPDGSHMYEKGHISFLMEEKGEVRHMVSCFR